MAGTTANAALIIKVEGIKGSGQTTWSFSGSDTAEQNGTIRTSQSSGNFSSGDTFDRAGTGAGDDFIADRSIQNVLVALSGTVKLTIGSQIRSITHLFLDSDKDPEFRFTSTDIGRIWADDFGIRVNKALSYTNGQSSSWSGIATVNLDIGKFLLGTYTFPSIYSPTHFGTFTISFSERTVAEPGSFALLALALASLGFSRKLTSAQAKA